MAFKWNGVHISTLEIIADAEVIPYIPEPKTVTEELPGRDGFLDFTEFNPAGRAHYLPRNWRFLCSLEMLPGDALTKRLGEIAAMFMVRNGKLEADDCPGVYWDAIITNRFDIAKIARNCNQFTVYFQSQPFARSLDPADEKLYVWSGKEFN
jgi:phage-related protein